MARAMAAGIAVFAAAYLLRCLVPLSATWLDLVAPALAGFAAAWVAPRRRLLVGTAMALPPALLCGAEMAVCEASRSLNCDRVGATGVVFLTAFTMVWNMVLCGGGAAVAAGVRSKIAARTA